MTDAEFEKEFPEAKKLINFIKKQKIKLSSIKPYEYGFIKNYLFPEQQEEYERLYLHKKSKS